MWYRNNNCRKEKRNSNHTEMQYQYVLKVIIVLITVEKNKRKSNHTEYQYQCVLYKQNKY